MAGADCILAVVRMEGDAMSASRQIYTALAHAVLFSNKMSKYRLAHDKTPGMQQYKRMTMFQIKTCKERTIVCIIPQTLANTGITK